MNHFLNALLFFSFLEKLLDVKKSLTLFFYKIKIDLNNILQELGNKSTRKIKIENVSMNF